VFFAPENLPVVPPKPPAFDVFLETYKPLLPIPGLIVAIAVLYLFFRTTWRELDEEAQRERGALLAEGRWDARPVVALVLCAFILTMQEYYGGRTFFDGSLRPWLQRLELTHPRLKLAKYDELYGFGWWAFTRVFGYAVVPVIVWKIAFYRDSFLDFGLRTRGFFKHIWIYAVLMLFMIPTLLIVSRQPDFGGYYPFYKLSPRSWFDFLTWEAMYFAQFFALEVFFRGFWLGALRRSFGSGAIFAMIVPYCMIHFQKPFLEVNGAVIAGILLGSLAMKTRSIHGGFLLHITVAGMMDWLALSHRHALPTTMWAP
jgi:membrane protease YdiL (CAAX protease family)